MIYIIGLDGIVRGILTNDIPHGVPYWDDMNEMSIVDGMDIFEFKAPAGNDTTAKIERENYVAIADYDDSLKLFKVREIETRHDSDGLLYKHVYAESAALELLKIPVRPIEFSAQTPEAIFEALLVSTLWRVGSVEINDVIDMEITDYMNTIEALLAVVAEVGGEIRYRVEIKNGRIEGRYIDLLERYGQYTGKRFTFGKDVTEIVRYEDSSQIFTAVIPVGISDADTGLPATIAPIARTYYNAQGTEIVKPVGQDYIGDPDALAKWSDDGQHLTAVLKLEESDPAVLAVHGWEFLKKHVYPKMTYDVSVVTLSKMTDGTYSHESVRLGDTVIVEDLNFELPLVLEARVVTHGRSMSNPSADFVRLGNYVELEISTESQIERLLATIRQKQSKWDETGEGELIVKQPTAPLNPTPDMLWVDTSHPTLNVWKRFDFDSGLWIPITPTEAHEIGAPTQEYVDQELDEVKDDIGEVSTIVTGTETRLSLVEQSVTSDSIRDVVMSSTEFELALATKANSEDLGDFATHDAVDAVHGELSELQREINTINFSEFAMLSDVEQTAQSLTTRFSASGGVNLIRNSTGFSGLDFWQAETSNSDENIGTTTSEELEALGVVSGFTFGQSSVNQNIYQRVRIIPNVTYTLSFHLKQTSSHGVFQILAMRDDGTTYGAFVSSQDADGEDGTFKRYSFTFSSPEESVRIQILATQSSVVELAGLMLNLGDVPFGWTTASGEIYNTHVKMDMQGIRVSQLQDGTETHFTMMTPEKFAGYYDVNGDGVIDISTGSVDEVFRVDRDEFRMKKANVESEITMGDIKIIQINAAGSRGWAFVAT